MLRKGQGRPRAEEGIGFLPTPRPTYHLQLQPRVRLKGPCLLRTPPHTLPPLWAPVLRNKVRGRPGSRAPRRLCDKGGEQQSWDRVGGGVPGHLQATPSHPCGDRGPLRPPTSAVSFLHDLTMAGSPCTPPPPGS